MILYICPYLPFIRFFQSSQDGLDLLLASYQNRSGPIYQALSLYVHLVNYLLDDTKRLPHLVRWLSCPGYAALISYVGWYDYFGNQFGIAFILHLLGPLIDPPF